MATVMVTLKIMPVRVETDLEELEKKANKEIEAFAGEEGRAETEEIAFGLKALKITFLMDESKGSTDALEEKIKDIEGVNSVDVIDVRRTLG